MYYDEVSRVRDSLEFFESVRAGFERAIRRKGPTDYSLLLGGYVIELRFASALLASKIMPALAHLVVPRSAPALTICLWDSGSTGVPLAFQAAELVAAAQQHWVGVLGPRGEIVRYHHSPIRAGYALGPGILSLLDTEHNLAVYWVEDAAQLAYYESASPLRTILSWWMGEHGRQIVHAGAVGTVDGGILLTGRGGSGKSSTALACLGSPLTFISDDSALVAIEPSPRVYGIYKTAKLNGQADLDRFPQLVPLVRNLDRVGEEKLLLMLNDWHAAQVAAGFSIKVLMVPRVTGNFETTVIPMAPGAALTALATTTLFQLSGSGKDALNRMASLVRRVPRYELLLGTDVSQIPDVLLDVLSKHRQ